MKQPKHMQLAEDDLRRQAVELGLEVLTPAAVIALWGKDEATVRAAANKGHIETTLTVQFSGKPVRLFRLSSCLTYWGQPEDAGLLEAMRAKGYPLFVSNADGNGGLPYSVLTTEWPVTQTGAAGPDRD